MHAEIIQQYFPQLNANQYEQFKEIGAIYEFWNSKINVISRKDIDSIYVHHVLHSLAIAKTISFPACTKVLDIGTGGGFPGIPLAILFPQTKFHLVDSIAKKIKVVEAVARALQLPNVSFEQIRAEKIKEKYHFIVSRAVTNFPDFVHLIKNRFIFDTSLPKQGLYYLKGGDFEQEIAPYKNRITLHDISIYFAEDFFETKKVIFYAAKQ